MRFLHYGYTKVTMAEIANDVDMSAANLYRYFESKQDIAAGCCHRRMAERLERLHAVVRNERLSAIEKLQRYAATMIEHTHEMADPRSKIGELVAIVTRERPAIVRQLIETHGRLLADILLAGNQSGEFEVDDVSATAMNLYGALVVFDVPLFIGLYSREDFDARARGVIDLLVGGLAKRK